MEKTKWRGWKMLRDVGTNAVRSGISDYNILFYAQKVWIYTLCFAACLRYVLGLIMCDSAWCALEKFFTFCFYIDRFVYAMQCTVMEHETNGCKQFIRETVERAEKKWNKLCRLDLESIHFGFDIWDNADDEGTTQRKKDQPTTMRNVIRFQWNLISLI